MRDVVDPRNASIDGLIDWLREMRRRQPDCSFAQLLAGQEFSADRLVDLACIDLMQQRRMGNFVSVETYLNDFPVLGCDQHRLDLIDAELCVSQELGQPIGRGDMLTRFPDLADPIAELMQLESLPAGGLAPPRMRIDDTFSSETDSSTSDSNTSDSLDFSLPGETSASVIAGLAVHLPVDLPEWFVGDRCIANGPGHWLVRGRDSVRGDTLAMKVIELPKQITNDQGEQILNACEKAAKVLNAAWVVPCVAAIQQRHLAVIRPWVFAPDWEVGAVSGDQTGQLRAFATVAFALQSAHDVGAAHGAIHEKNLIRDHDGKTCLVDAVAGLRGLRRWIHSAGQAAEVAPLVAARQRQRLDIEDLIKLVAAASIEWEESSSRSLVSDLRAIANQFPGEASGRIGESLIKCADGGSTPAATRWVGRDGSEQRPTWRKRLAEWIAGS